MFVFRLYCYLIPSVFSHSCVWLFCGRKAANCSIHHHWGGFLSPQNELRATRGTRASVPRWERGHRDFLTWVIRSQPLLQHYRVCGEKITHYLLHDHTHFPRHYLIYTGWPPKNGTVDFLGLCSDQQLSFFTSLDRTSFPHYNNTKIIKFGWKLFILWVISYGL